MTNDAFITNHLLYLYDYVTIKGELMSLFVHTCE